jgi:hypothetical protein
VSVLAVSICRLPFVLLLLFLTGDDIGFGYRDDADFGTVLTNLRPVLDRRSDDSGILLALAENQNQKQINQCLILYCNEDGGCESDQRSSFT